MVRSFVFAMLAVAVFATSLPAATFNVVDDGATPNDDLDDTVAVAKVLAACGEAGGGTVFIPAGSFIITRQGAESPILGLPSNTTLCGEGAASTLQFPKRASESNFWRMLGNGPEGGVFLDCLVVDELDAAPQLPRLFDFLPPISVMSDFLVFVAGF